MMLVKFASTILFNSPM